MGGGGGGGGGEQSFALIWRQPLNNRHASAFTMTMSIIWTLSRNANVFCKCSACSSPCSSIECCIYGDGVYYLAHISHPILSYLQDTMQYSHVHVIMVTSKSMTSALAQGTSFLNIIRYLCPFPNTSCKTPRLHGVLNLIMSLPVHLQLI